ncbi:hypothetical protein LC085_06645 [Bacillus tianshenii]|uniref:hypothetical protein n=1 Tax=Sutcliffiella tianshenii TaxID=1463404 RepID=UPI001CD814FC|nr:hypothetical protein [Bacillus tianshenii]MCA1319588.1 hypothetical protein [Bacillus tianshenii]
MADALLYFIFMIPVYGVLIWSYLCPEESMLFGERWMYKEEPEFSEDAIRYTKFAASVGIFGITMILVLFVIENRLIKFFIILGFIIYVVIGGYKLLKKYLDL